MGQRVNDNEERQIWMKLKRAVIDYVRDVKTEASSHSSLPV